MPHPSQKVECIIPVLPVSNMLASSRFYIERLGFTLDWGNPSSDTVCSVSRDGRAIMLKTQKGDIPTTWIWIGLEDDSLFEEYRARGITVLQEPQNHPWAYEMKFADLDGNILWLGTEPKTNIPFAS